MQHKIVIREDFSDTPGARNIQDGPYSGEAFYEEILKKSFDEAVKSGSKLYIDLDGTWGYASSFLSSSFGVLSKEHGPDKVLNVLSFISNDSPFLVHKIRNIITNPDSQV